MTEDEDGFVDLTPRSSKDAAARPAVAVTTLQLRGAHPLLSLSFSSEAAAALGEGRITVAWKERDATLRLRSDPNGLFQILPNRHGRLRLRIPLPSGLLHRPRQMEPCPRRQDGKALFLTVPPAFRKPVDPKVAIGAAKAAVPAPNFSGKKKS